MRGTGIEKIRGEKSERVLLQHLSGEFQWHRIARNVQEAGCKVPGGRVAFAEEQIRQEIPLVRVPRRFQVPDDIHEERQKVAFGQGAFRQLRLLCKGTDDLAVNFKAAFFNAPSGQLEGTLDKTSVTRTKHPLEERPWIRDRRGGVFDQIKQQGDFRPGALGKEREKGNESLGVGGVWRR